MAANLFERVKGPPRTEAASSEEANKQSDKKHQLVERLLEWLMRTWTRDTVAIFQIRQRRAVPIPRTCTGFTSCKHSRGTGQARLSASHETTSARLDRMEGRTQTSSATVVTNKRQHQQRTPRTRLNKNYTRPEQNGVRCNMRQIATTVPCESAHRHFDPPYPRQQAS